MSQRTGQYTFNECGDISVVASRANEHGKLESQGDLLLWSDEQDKLKSWESAQENPKASE